jgi:hypothetical protein
MGCRSCRTSTYRLPCHCRLEQQQQYSAQWFAGGHYQQRAEQCTRTKHNWVGRAAAYGACPA